MSSLRTIDLTQFSNAPFLVLRSSDAQLSSLALIVRTNPFLEP